MGKVCGASLGQPREKGREEGLQSGRKVMSLVAKEYGYKGQEIAEYLRRDPAVITRYLWEGKKFEIELERVHKRLRESGEKVNKQVRPHSCS